MMYKTTETYEAALFKALCYPFIESKKIERPNGKTAIEFTFDIPSLSTVQNIIKDYFNHVLEVDAYEFYEALKFARKEIYTKLKEKEVPIKSAESKDVFVL